MGAKPHLAGSSQHYNPRSYTSKKGDCISDIGHCSAVWLADILPALLVTAIKPTTRS